MTWSPLNISLDSLPGHLGSCWLGKRIRGSFFSVIRRARFLFLSLPCQLKVNVLRVQIYMFHPLLQAAEKRNEYRLKLFDLTRHQARSKLQEDRELDELSLPRPRIKSKYSTPFSRYFVALVAYDTKEKPFGTYWRRHFVEEYCEFDQWLHAFFLSISIIILNLLLLLS